MLVLKASLYQYALCNSATVNYRCYWHGEELRIHKLEETFWSPNEEEISYLREVFSDSDLIVLLPAWVRYNDCNNLRMGLLVQSDPNLSRIPLHIYAFSNEMLHNLSEAEREFVEKLIGQKRLTYNFTNIFASINSLAENSEWRQMYKEYSIEEGTLPPWIVLETLKEEICIEMIQYALTIEIQKLLSSHKCYGGTIDGWFSDRTKHAVRRFQKLHDLEEKGVLNRETWSRLQKHP